MDNKIINKDLLNHLIEQASSHSRLRMSFDLRTSLADHSQRMLNVLLPGTEVPIHRHPHSNENVLLLCGKLVEVIYDEQGNESERIPLDPLQGKYGCVVPPGVWHTVEVLEASVLYESKDGRYGEDGSETLAEVQCSKASVNSSNTATLPTEASPATQQNIKSRIVHLIEMEQRSGAMVVMSPLYVARMLNLPLEKVEQVMKKEGLT